jgi:hypothetical protein
MVEKSDQNELLQDSGANRSFYSQNRQSSRNNQDCQTPQILQTADSSDSGLSENLDSQISDSQVSETKQGHSASDLFIKIDAMRDTGER